jgi:hypothetical protein
MKLFLFRLLWVVGFLVEVLGCIVNAVIAAVIILFKELVSFPFSFDLYPMPEEIAEPFFYLETEAFFDRESSPLEPPCDVLLKVNRAPKYKQPGLQYVRSGDDAIPVIVASADIGYRVTGVDNPNIFGNGSSITIAKYDFLTSYNHWKASRKLIGGYFEEN